MKEKGGTPFLGREREKPAQKTRTTQPRRSFAVVVVRRRERGEDFCPRLLLNNALNAEDTRGDPDGVA